MRLKDITGKTLRQTVEEALLLENASSGASCAANIATVPGGKAPSAQGAIGVGFDPNGFDRGIYPKPKTAKKGKGTVIRRVTEGLGSKFAQYWITQDGELMDVTQGFGGHERAALDYFDIEEPEGDDFGNDEYRGSDEAYGQGWIRVSADGKEFGADWQNTTRSALTALGKLISTLPEYSVYYFDKHRATDQSDAYKVLRKIMNEYPR